MSASTDAALRSSLPRAASLERLRELLIDEGGLMASLAGASQRAIARARRLAGPRSSLPQARAPRAVARSTSCLIEAIYEGYLLHYGSRAWRARRISDLGLLAGDRLYALGLARLVALGDLAAVAELADTITLSALAQGAGEPELAEAVWAAGARAIGWGSSESHRRAKDLVFDGLPKAIEAMRTSAASLAAPR